MYWVIGRSTLPLSGRRPRAASPPPELARQIEGYRFRRQVPIGHFTADFVCHKARVIVEIDGGQHDPSSAAEMRRTRFLQSEGYRVLRFWNNEVLDNPDGVHTAIAECLHRLYPHPNPPP